MSNFIRTVRAHEGEIVEIAWTCKDGSVFHQRVTVPPSTTREALTADRAVADDVRKARRKEEAGT